MIRLPAVAGTFYPSHPRELKAAIDHFLSLTEKIQTTGKLRILIVPHAGIVYSGQTAAWGFKQIEDQNIKRVILLGASHRSWIDGAAVYPSGAWQTPLGMVDIDEKCAMRLVDNLPHISADPEAHAYEHSLEVELIFLQTVLKKFTIVPILLGQIDDQCMHTLAQNISAIMNGQTVLVVSTDLSHYPDWEMANKVDNLTIKAILTSRKDRFRREFDRIENLGLPGVETAACGYKAIEVALKVAELQKITDFKKIYYQNSGDVAGDKSRVVGYATIGGFK